jgi:hypothetical protein
MAITASYLAATSYTGFGLGSTSPVAQDNPTTTPANTNAPPPGSINLGAGNNQIPVPSLAQGYTFTRVELLPLGVGPSTNAKTLKYNLADAGSASWTAGSVVIPIAPGGALYIVSTTYEGIGVYFS